MISNPTDTYNKLFQPRTDSVAVVIEEYLNTGAVTDEQLESFVVREGLSEYADKISDPMIRHLILKLYQSERSKFKVRMPAKTETLSGIRKSIATEIMYKSGLQYEGDKHKPFKFVGRAMKEMLGLPQDAKMEDDSDYDIPQVHYVLMNHNVRKCIKQMAITDLIRDGQIPHLSYIMREQVK